MFQGGEDDRIISPGFSPGAVRGHDRKFGMMNMIHPGIKQAVIMLLMQIPLLYDTGSQTNLIHRNSIPGDSVPKLFLLSRSSNPVCNIPKPYILRRSIKPEDAMPFLHLIGRSNMPKDAIHKLHLLNRSSTSHDAMPYLRLSRRRSALDDDPGFSPYILRSPDL